MAGKEKKVNNRISSITLTIKSTFSIISLWYREYPYFYDTSPIIYEKPPPIQFRKLLLVERNKPKRQSRHNKIDIIILEKF